MSFDAIELEVLWQSLIATVNEQARALQRAAFSPIVREAGDLANAVFDRRGRMVAQAVTGTPGHINSLARAASAMLDEYPTDSLVEGDVLVTNDPYKTAGQLLDVTVLYPVFVDGRVFTLVLHDPGAVRGAGDDVGGGLKAPMPGKVIALVAAPGAAVGKGAPLLVLEAMKMEHTIVAPRAGTVKGFHYAAGDQVGEGADLVDFEAAA